MAHIVKNILSIQYCQEFLCIILKMLRYLTLQNDLTWGTVIFGLFSLFSSNCFFLLHARYFTFLLILFLHFIQLLLSCVWGSGFMF